MKLIADTQLIKLSKRFFHGATRFDAINSDAHKNSQSIIISRCIIPKPVNFWFVKQKPPVAAMMPSPNLPTCRRDSAQTRHHTIAIFAKLSYAMALQNFTYNYLY